MNAYIFASVTLALICASSDSTAWLLAGLAILAPVPVVIIRRGIKRGIYN